MQIWIRIQHIAVIRICIQLPKRMRIRIRHPALNTGLICFENFAALCRCGSRLPKWCGSLWIRNTVQYRKCVFQIVLESGSEDSQPGLILPSGAINWTLNIVNTGSAYFRSSWSPEVKTRSLAWSCPPGRSTEHLILFNTGSVYFRSSWSPEVKTHSLVWSCPRGRSTEHLTLFNTGSAYFRSSWSPEVKTHSLAWSCPRGRSTEHLTLFNTGSAYFRSSWSPEVMTRSLAGSCPQGRSSEHLTLFNTGSVRISDRTGVRKWRLAAWPDPALGGDQLELSLPGRHGRRSLRSWLQVSQTSLKGPCHEMNIFFLRS